jgi:hypothetical protein
MMTGIGHGRQNARRQAAARRGYRALAGAAPAWGAVYPVEIDAATFDLMEQYARLKPGQMDNRKAVSSALGRLLHLALAALLR